MPARRSSISFLFSASGFEAYSLVHSPVSGGAAGLGPASRASRAHLRIQCPSCKVDVGQPERDERACGALWRGCGSSEAVQVFWPDRRTFFAPVTEGETDRAIFRITTTPSFSISTKVTMKFAKSLLAAGVLTASFAASATVVGSLGGGTGSFLALSGGSAPAASPDSCTAATPCTLGGTVASIVGGSTLTGDAAFADADAFNGGLVGGRFLAAGPTVGNTSTLTFGTAVNYISFLWGSPDTYNLLTVNSAGASQTFDVSGTHAGATSLGFASTNGNQSFSQYVQFVGTGITSLVFTNTPGVDAFEAGNFDVAIAAVPEPETYALMLAGLGALSFISRRRKLA